MMKLMNIMILLLLNIIAFANADVMLDIYKASLDNTVSPCDNFYRHACKIGVGHQLKLDDAFKNYMYNFSNPEVKNLYETYPATLWDDVPVLQNYLNSDSINVEVKTQYSQWCQEGNRKNMNYFMYKLFGKKIKDRKHSCEVEESILSEFLQRSEIARNNALSKTLYALIDRIILSIFDDLSLKSKNVPGMLMDMFKMTYTLVKETPWAKQYNVVEQIENAISEVHLLQYYEKGYKTAKLLRHFDKDYSNCNKNLQPSTTTTKAMCLVIAAKYNPVSPSSKPFWDAFNMKNRNIRLGPFYYFPELVKANTASEIGYAGFLVGHEFAHTLFEAYDPEDTWYTNFTNIGRKCVLNQYASICDNFKEQSCQVDETFLEESGADIVGQRLAYNILAQYLGPKLKENYPGYNVTNEQLFFYGYAANYCDGRLSKAFEDDPHAADNVRINAIVNLPEFQSAFSCSADSKMMRARTEECHIFGPNAPQTK